MYRIQNGTLHLPGGTVLPQTDLLMDGQRIVKIGPNLSADAETYDAAGQEVFAGLILPVTSIGLTDYANLARRDCNEDSGPITPDLHVKYSIEAREVAIQEYQGHGVTAFGAAPGTHGVIAGQMGVYHTAGSCAEEMAVRETVAVKANFNAEVKQTFGPRNQMPMTRMGMASLLRAALEKAARYDASQGWDPACEALQPLLRGARPLLCSVNTAAEIATVLDIAGTFGVKVILHGAYQAGRVAEAVIASGTPVLMGDLISCSYAAAYEADLDALLALKHQGVAMGLSNSGDNGSMGHECLMWSAQKLVRDAGADPDEVMDMLTIDTARILGVDDVTGSIEEGKFADVAVWTGHPLRQCAAHVSLCAVAGQIWRADQ